MLEIVIHGLGYVGLTAAVHYARAGWTVLGYDVEEKIIAALNAGEPRAMEFLSYVNDDVRKLVKAGKLAATCDFERVAKQRVHVVCVPTERDGHPYDHIIEAALSRLLMSVPDDALIMIESTLTPGFVDHLRTNELFKRVGTSVSLAVCPRRDWFADPEKNLETLPRIVGGVTAACTARAIEVIKTVSKTIHVTSYRTAELTKALENALLHVLVMFAYQLAYAMPEHDVAEALRLAGTHWRLTPLYLGFGTGGRCVPLGTEYLVKASRERLQLGRAAIDWDRKFRSVIADVVEKISPKRVLVLGMAYRPQFRDMGMSPGLHVAQELRRRSIHTNVHDTMWTTDEIERTTGFPVPSLTEMKHFDVVLLATPHSAYLELPTNPKLWRRGQYVLDGSGAWASKRGKFDERGVIYRQVGEPGWMTPQA